eukprot:TRINITY_DN5076_c0_g1_i2.p4 TRINITY_DN5076_c0_g1~~TRINITY_DN5076_c0_g1_i2.p4  ORF type:complete len:349 (+),score=111.13 TRINITY_DN5076_c0_g1_i2:1284-2330(+)
MAAPSRPFRAFAAVMRGVNRLNSWEVDERLLRGARAACQAVPNFGPFFGLTNMQWGGDGGTTALYGKPPWGYKQREYGGHSCIEFTPRPGAANARPGVIVYVHGGAYILGTAAMTKSLAAVLCHLSGMRVVSVEYSLAPEHPLPRATHDVAAAVRSIAAQSHREEPIALVGDSAGGGLVLLTTQLLKAAGGVAPRCVVAISPWADLTCTAGTYLENQERDLMLGAQPYPDSFEAVSHMAVGNLDAACQPTGAGQDRADPTFSPLFGCFEGFPPTHIMVGSDEMLLDDARRLHERCREAGVDATLTVAPGMCHSYPMFTPLFPEADAGAREIANYVVEQFATPTPAAAA